MTKPWLPFSLLLVLCWCLAGWITPWFQSWAGNRAQSNDILQVALGDGKRLFARHAYAKADAYFHSGYYPSIFDHDARLKKQAQANTTSLQSEACKGDWLGAPENWIDRFGRHFYPSKHVHLGAEAEGHVHGPDCNHDEGHDAHAEGGGPVHEVGHVHGPDCGHDHATEKPSTERLQKEILPWLRLSASLDPNRIETYVVGSYWLRRELERPEVAQQFLREGLQANPLHPGLLFELGRIFYEVHEDADQARNIWEAAARQWRLRNSQEEAPEWFTFEQILGNLARLEENQGRWSEALVYLGELKGISPYPDHIEKWIREISAKIPQP